MKVEYRRWLEQNYGEGTASSRMSNTARVEKYHGDLDKHYDADRMKTLVETLRYSSEDSRRNRLNPSKIPVDGDIYNNLAMYRGAVELYRRFRETAGDTAGALESGETRIEFASTVDEQVGQRIGLERDMQAALRVEINQLEQGLTIIDDGSEHSVDSGSIDITARDVSGATVVIELKAGTVGQRAIAQILSYMGDVAAEDENRKVRGILVGSSFDAKAKAAARMVPNLILRKYSVRFLFSDGHA
jgi:endonuclease